MTIIELTKEEIELLDGRLQVELSWGTDVYTQDELDRMTQVRNKLTFSTRKKERAEKILHVLCSSTCEEWLQTKLEDYITGEDGHMTKEEMVSDVARMFLK